MPQHSKDQIGRIGEWIASTEVSRAVERDFQRPLFRPVFLGEKYPLADLLVDVLDNDGRAAGFFLVQVRSTFSSNRRTRRFSLTVPKSKCRQLARIPVPAYLFGVEIGTREVFLAGIAPESEVHGGATIGTRYPLNEDDVMIQLYREVFGFWERCRPLLPRSRFCHE